MAKLSNLIDKIDLALFLQQIKGLFSSKDHNHATLTIKDGLGGEKQYDGTSDVTVAALNGEAGYSPTIDVEEGDGEHTITIKDKNGTKTVTVKDGANGGADGVTYGPESGMVDEKNPVFNFVAERAQAMTAVPDTWPFGSGGYQMAGVQLYGERKMEGVTGPKVWKQISIPYLLTDLTDKFVMRFPKYNGSYELLTMAQPTGGYYDATIYKPTFSVTDTTGGGKKLTIKYGGNTYELETPGASTAAATLDLKVPFTNSFLSGNAETVLLETKTEVEAADALIHTVEDLGYEFMDKTKVKVNWHFESDEEYVGFSGEVYLPGAEDLGDKDLSDLLFKLPAGDGSSLTFKAANSLNEESDGSLLTLTNFNISDGAMAGAYYLDYVAIV